MRRGIACLLSDDTAEAAKIAAQLDALNRERRNIEAEMQDSALAALELINRKVRHAHPDAPKVGNPHPIQGWAELTPHGAPYGASLVLFDETWHQGVIGILASRLKDRFHRPVIAFARAANGEIKGSGRSIPALHLRDALDLVSKRHPLLLQKFGGHAMAAGVSIREEHFNEFRTAFESALQNLLTPTDLTRIIETDGPLLPSDFSLDNARTLEQQAWGQGFPQPAFEGAFTVESQRVVGEKHLKLQLRCVTPRAQGKLVEAMLFGQNEPLPEQIHAVYSLCVNEYNGAQSLQLIIRHWRHEG